MNAVRAYYKCTDSLLDSKNTLFMFLQMKNTTDEIKNLKMNSWADFIKALFKTGI